MPEMEIDKTVNLVVKLYELRLLRCSLSSYPTLPCPAEDQSAENYISHINTVVEHIEKGEYAEALHSEAARFVLNGVCDDEFVSECPNSKEGANKFYCRLEDRVTVFLRGSEDYSNESAWLDFLDSDKISSNLDIYAPYRALLVMALGIASFSIFVQCNLTGPHGDFERFPFSHGSKQEMVMLDEQTEWERWSFQQLMSDGCDLLGKYVLPEYFVLAKILLLKTRQITNEYDNMSIICPKSIAWWSSRLLLVQQKLLDERSRSLHDQLQVTMEETLKHFGQSTNVMGYWENELHKGDASDIVAAANLEAGIKELVYSYVDRARQFFKQAEAACGLRLSVTGALGFRTVHQTEAKAQMVLVAAPLNEESERRSDKVQMDNSLVHNKIKIFEGHTEHSSNDYEDSDILLAPRLIEAVEDGGVSTSVENVSQSNSKIFDTIKQAVILAECLDIKKSTPDDDLQDWQMAPYIEAVGAQNFSYFMVRCLYQILRIRWEHKRSRTKQRSMLMMDELAQEVRGYLTPAADRMHYAYCVDFPTIPALLKEYAELMVSCGIVGDALRIFEELELWDNLIYCYRLLGKNPAAIDLIKERLQHNPEDPRLWCSLGDVTLNDDNYIKALEVSGNRFARAERSLARSAYNRGEYKLSQSHWEAALALNSLHPDGWFALGSAALKARDFDKAIDGFTRAVQLDPDNGEAWNNIACLHMMKKRNKEAFTAFKEALKFRRNSWQMWENYSQVAMDIGNFGQALEAIKMVLDLTNNKRVDIDLLSKLVEEMESRNAPDGSLGIAANGPEKNLQCSNYMNEIQSNKTTNGQSTDKQNDTMGTGSVDKENYGGIKYSFEEEQMVDLIGRILQQIVRSGEGGGDIWGLFARFHKFKGNLVTCSESLLKQVRAYQGSELKNNEDCFKKFARASLQLCELYIDIASSTSSKRELNTAQMHLRNAIKQAENFSGLGEYKALEACLQLVQKQLEATSL
ncbi:uncharacterized protein LOC131078433 [Cryptomeria japonica]|uniref:uncharacterized protein LOC131078433 n=1 Tax=Cryptomeria japonica TaxID=3369 RepID=UPI0027DA78C9|nr:uncharacterized protein LOC131078433 [Cryptomeria japonica]